MSEAGKTDREFEPKAAQRGSGLPCSSTSGLYIRPLINPEWRPGSDRLTGQAPAQDRPWFITTELQPALIYFSWGERRVEGLRLRGLRGGHRAAVLLNRRGNSLRLRGYWSDGERWVICRLIGSGGFLMLCTKRSAFIWAWAVLTVSQLLERESHDECEGGRGGGL